jgi:hypothetical protein
LRTNGPAIYGTRPWTTTGAITRDGIPFHWTRGEDALHAIILGTPEGDVVELPDVTLDASATVELLGHDLPLRWEPDGSGVRVMLRERPPISPALTLRITPAPQP